MNDKRISPRQRVLKGGKIIFADGAFSIDCIIRNVSQIGARLEVPSSVPIPDTFFLVDSSSGKRQKVDVVWRKGNLMGVRYRPGA